MTVLEQRFMESVPHFLSDLVEALQEHNNLVSEQNELLREQNELIKKQKSSALDSLFDNGLPL